MRTCGQNLNLRECHSTPRYLATVYSLTLLKLLDTCRRSLRTPKHQKFAKIVTTIFKRNLDGSCGWRGKIARHRGCLAWQLLMLTPAHPYHSFQLCALSRVETPSPARWAHWASWECSNNCRDMMQHTCESAWHHTRAGHQQCSQLRLTGRHQCNQLRLA